MLIAGDAARMVRGLRLAVVNSDFASAGHSFARRAALESDTACFGHAPVLRGRASAAFRRRVEQPATRT